MVHFQEVSYVRKRYLRSPTGPDWRTARPKAEGFGDEVPQPGNFIHQRSREVFDGVPWISVRHLSSLESGKNWISIEMLIQHAYALEMDPVELFRELLQAYQE